MWGRAFRIERGVLFYGEKSAIINRIGEVGDMGRLDMGVSAKGVGAGIVCGMLLTGYAALSPLCHLTLSPQTVILPLLSVWTGPMSSLICAGAACISSASALGANMAVWMLVKALPGLLCAWLIQQRIGYFRKMAIFLGISAVSALGWAAYESLRAQGHLIENLAERMAYGPYGAGGICIPGISGYFSAAGTMNMLSLDREADEFGTLAYMMRDEMRRCLPAGVCVWAAVTGMLSCAVPMRYLARHGETDKQTYVPIEKWAVPQKWIMGMCAMSMAAVIWTSSGSYTGAGAATVVLRLTALILSVHGAGGICSRLKRGDVPRGRRLGIVIALALIGGILPLAGAWRLMFGSGGLWKRWKDSLHNDDEGGEE